MLGFMLRQLVRKGTLTVTWHDGSKTTYGIGLPKAAMSIHGRWSSWTIDIRPDIAWIMPSKAAVLAAGPTWPKPETAQ